VAAITALTLMVRDAATLPVAHALDLFTLLDGETTAAAMMNHSKAQLAVLREESFHVRRRG
jgi:hypothetical protein